MGNGRLTPRCLSAFCKLYTPLMYFSYLNEYELILCMFSCTFIEQGYTGKYGIRISMALVKFVTAHVKTTTLEEPVSAIALKFLQLPAADLFRTWPSNWRRIE